jgi:hypothetical protein
MRKFDLRTLAFRNGIVGVLLAFTASGAQAGSPFATFDIPGASTQAGYGTFPAAISGKNVITGQYVDTGVVYHGFIGTVAGGFTSFDAPGAGTGSNEGTVATAINLSGTVTGNYVDDHAHGFVRHSDGSFETFSIGTDTNPTAINDRGVVVGNSYPNGFLRRATGLIKTFAVPGAASTLPVAINNNGVIAGYYYDSSNFKHGFIRAHDGTVTTVDAPGGFDNSQIVGINAAGDVVGNTSNNAAYRAFVRTHDGAITVFNPSGCPQTFAAGINFDGTVVGNCYINGDFIYYGFTRKLDGTTTMYSPPGAGAFGTFPRSIAANGKSVGYFTDSSDIYHGYRLNAGK